jgi:methyl-accepting chemotaxis protein
MTLGRKIIVSSLVAVGISLIIGLASQAIVLRKQGTELILNSMRGIMDSAESIRDHVSNLNSRKAFRQAELLDEFRKQGGELRQSALYGTIPIVSAWRSIEAAAEKQGYEFRIPKNDARNPKNLPVEDEVEILRSLESSGLSEMVRIDSQSKKIVYARPIKLTQECLVCHGDPKNSPTGDGKDFLGFRMENWKEGEIHGAFVLKTDISRLDAQTWKSFTDTLWIVIPATLIFVVIMSATLIYTTRRFILKPIERSINIIDEDSEREVGIATQITDSSTNLANSATSQAASLEETSAALEEISSMTKRNAENAESAQTLATETRKAADTGAGDMQEMIKAMNEIKAASDNIAAIIKTIDEIAFQTNILALNAAVEAARAGDAGSGFAVVADEVRALAQRSAHAARETADKIEDSIKKSEHGVVVSSKVAQSLAEIVERARKVDELVKEIASGSREQSQGITQVNEAIGDLDRATQANAATAEQSAGAATELKGQSEQLKVAVDELVAIVGLAQRRTSDESALQQQNAGVQKVLGQKSSG